MYHEIEKTEIQLIEDSIAIIMEFIATIEENSPNETKEKLKVKVKVLKERAKEIHALNNSMQNYRIFLYWFMDEIKIRNEIQNLLLQICVLEEKYHDAIKNVEFQELKNKIRSEIKDIQVRVKALEKLLADK